MPPPPPAHPQPAAAANPNQYDDDIEPAAPPPHASDDESVNLGEADGDLDDDHPERLSPGQPAGAAPNNQPAGVGPDGVNINDGINEDQEYNRIIAR